MKRSFSIVLLFCLIALSMRHATSQSAVPGQSGQENSKQSNNQTTLPKIPKAAQQNNERWQSLLQQVNARVIAEDLKRAEELAEQLRRETESADSSDPISAGINKAFRGLSLQFLGIIRAELNKNEQASADLQEALRLFQEVDPRETSTWGSRALCLLQIGKIALFDHRYDAAKDYFDQALKRFELVEGNSPLALQFRQSAEFMQSYALCLGDMGHIHKLLYEDDLALKEFEHALGILRQYDFKALLPTAKFEMAFLHAEIGSIHRRHGRWSETLFHSEQAILIYKQVGNKIREIVNANIISCKFDLGASYEELGLYKEATGLLQEAYDGYRRLSATRPDQRRKGEIGMASCIHELGSIDEDRGMFEQAISKVKDAYKIYERYQYYSGMATCKASLGRIYMERVHGDAKVKNPSQETKKKLFQEAQANMVEAQRLEQKASPDFSMNGMRKDVKQAINDFALARVNFLLSERPDRTYSQQSWAELLSQTTKASEVFKTFDYRIGVINCQGFRAICCRQLAEMKAPGYSLEDARKNFEAVIQDFELLNNRITIGEVPEVVTGYATNGLYLCYAEVLLQMNTPVEDALAMVERGRANELEHQTAIADITQSLPLAPEETQLLKRLKSERALAWKKLKSVSGLDKNHRNLLVAYQEADLEYLQVQSCLYAQEKYRNLSTPPRQRTGKEFLKLAEDHPDTLYLEWAFLDDNTAILYALGAKHGVQVFLIRSVEPLSSLCERWRTLLTRNVPDEEPKLARKLYDLLMGQVAARNIMKDYRRLVLIPDGPMWNIPFAALLQKPTQKSPKGTRLIESYPISIDVSLGSLLRPVAKHQPTRQMYCVADFTAQSNGLAPEQQAQRSTHAPLPFTKREQDQARKLFPKDSAYPSGENGREASVKVAMPQYAILYFAVHGQYMGNKKFEVAEDRGDGLSSYLLMSPEPYKSEEDGRLEAREIMNMKLNADLAILSACETGLGEPRGGDGLIGLTWAFQAAGCRAVTSSLWSVNDPKTAELMTEYLSNLHRGEAKDVALQHATIKLYHSHPAAYFWAAFELFGDTSPLSH